MIKDTMKQQLKQLADDMLQQKDEKKFTNEQWAESMATIMSTHIKQALTQVITAGVAVPQDGGTSLKTTMLAQVNSI